MTQHLTPGLAEAKLTAAAHQLAALLDEVRTAYSTLADSQPGYPTGAGGPGQRNAVSDRTGTLATSRPDGARTDLDNLDRLVRRITADIAEAERIAHSWQPPTRAWRDALATEAAAHLTDTDRWCLSHLQANSFERPRTEGARLCRWCEDVARDIGTDLPPTWLVDKRARGSKITSADLTRARREARTKRKRRRSA